MLNQQIVEHYHYETCLQLIDQYETLRNIILNETMETTGKI
jgi:hypothetical protein